MVKKKEAAQPPPEAAAPTLADQFLGARRAGTPLVAVTTADPAATMLALRCGGALEALDDLRLDDWNAANHGGSDEPEPEARVFRWDVVDGVSAMDKESKAQLSAACVGAGGEGQDLDPSAMTSLTSALVFARRLPPDSVLFAINPHRVLEGDGPEAHEAMQAVWNLRDRFKEDYRTLVLLVPHASLPVELQQDVVVLHDAVPDEARLEAIVRDVARDQQPSDADVERAVLAVRGLTAFSAEQVVAMSLRKSGIDLPGLWARKKATIGQVDGLSVMEGPERFSDLRDLDGIVAFLCGVIAGPDAPSVVVFMDEVEKQFAGAQTEGGDSTGVSQDKMGVALQALEDHEWTGLILFGVPGAGKTHLAKAFANEAGALAVKLDLGATSHKHVGVSEARIRRCMDVLYACGGKKRVFFVVTANKLTTLPPELKRRFRMGVWFFDLPSAQGLRSMWAVQCERHGIDPRTEWPDSTNWSGANVRDCCDIARRLKITPAAAARYVVPTMRSDSKSITDARALAHDRFICAARGETYVRPDARAEATGERKVRV